MFFYIGNINVKFLVALTGGGGAGAGAGSATGAGVGAGTGAGAGATGAGVAWVATAGDKGEIKRERER